MVLLHLTPALRSRLDALAPRLPRELRAQVGAFLVDEAEVRTSSGEQASGRPGAVEAMKEQGQRTVPHELLARVSRWARGKEDLEDPGAHAFEQCQRTSES